MAGLTIRRPDGSLEDVHPEPLPIEMFRDWVFGVYPRYPTGLPPDEAGSRDRQRRDESFWTETLPDGTLYIAYHEVRAKSGDLTIGGLAREVEAAPSSSTCGPTRAATTRRTARFATPFERKPPSVLVGSPC